MPMILEGRPVLDSIKEKVRDEVSYIDKQITMAVVVVGNNPASEIYVRNKVKDCNECGIDVIVERMDANSTTMEIVKHITSLNTRDDIHGIMVQLPLPERVDTLQVMKSIKPLKDVDGLHPYNSGLLMEGNPEFIPCTPGGIMELFKYYGMLVNSKNCVIIGRSNIVGRPLGALLLQNDATVTICHSRTKDLPRICKHADIIFSAVGQPNFINESFIRDGAIIIDISINHTEDGKLCGDVTPSVYDKLMAYTPVPGGVGLVTRGMLLNNIMKTYKFNYV